MLINTQNKYRVMLTYYDILNNKEYHDTVNKWVVESYSTIKSSGIYKAHNRRYIIVTYINPNGIEQRISLVMINKKDPNEFIGNSTHDYYNKLSVFFKSIIRSKRIDDALKK